MLNRMGLRSLIPENIPSSAKLFLTGVIFGGIANGIFGVVLQLYLTSLGFSGSTLGSIFMLNALLDGDFVPVFQIPASTTTCNSCHYDDGAVANVHAKDNCVQYHGEVH